MNAMTRLINPLKKLTLTAAVSTFVATTALVATDVRTASADDAPETLAELLIAASGDASLDNNPFDYDIIVQTVIALEALGGDPDLGGATLLEVLSNPEAEVTVFVPRDSAFHRLARDLGWDGKGGDAVALSTITGTFDLATIRSVVKYHVVPGRFSILKVMRTKTFETALPDATFRRAGIRLKDNDPDIKDARLTLPVELRAGAGTAHTITRVMIPLDL